MRSRSLPSPTFLLCLACAALVAVPLWLHRWLPIQDLPQHLATLRVVHDVHTGTAPAAGVYVTHLGSTQYLLFYIVGDLLSYLVSVRTAGLLIMTSYMLGTVAAAYALLRSLGRDPRLCLLAVPLLTNSQLLIGLLQFVIGIPLMLYGWSLALDTVRRWRRRSAVGLAIVAVLVFYSHVVVFGIFGIGLAVIAPWGSLRRLVRYWVPIVPVGIAVVYWAFFTASGDFVRNAITSGTENKDLWPFWVSCRAMYELAFDTYRDSADEKLFAMFVVTAVALTVLARRDHARPVVSTARWLLIPLACAVLYFRSEGTNGFLGHIRDRFVLLAVMAMLPTFRMPRGVLGHLGTVAMVVISYMTAETFQWHLTRFEREDVGDFSAALDHIPPDRRVAGLIFESESRYFGQNPFLHYPSYYLVERGGRVNFSFAGYPHWPFGYRPHQDPLGASPPTFLWEWQPWRVQTEDLAASYDYVLTRGDGFDAPDTFWKSWEGTDWAVW
ncbi:MAG TPA: hypothetical protein VHS09_00330, partial [Polyangiaceae bacterium]|nr:hypothetical protein [Polyangiaceae bacterium]